MEDMILPESNLSIKFTENYNEDALAQLAKDVVKDAALASRVKNNPHAELSNIGIQIEGDTHDITDADILAALGHHPHAPQAAAMAAVVVVVGVLNSPRPVE